METRQNQGDHRHCETRKETGRNMDLRIQGPRPSSIAARRRTFTGEIGYLRTTASSPAAPLNNKAQHSSPSRNSISSAGGADSASSRRTKSAFDKTPKSTVTATCFDPNVNLFPETSRIAPRECETLMPLPMNEKPTDLCSAHQSRKIIKAAYREIAIVISAGNLALVELTWEKLADVCLAFCLVRQLSPHLDCENSGSRKCRFSD